MSSSADELTDEEKSIPETKFEYLDHTADVQIHAWGHTLAEAFEQSANAMFGYMTEIETIDITSKHDIEVEAEDLYSLLYQFLDEFLFSFCAEPFFIARVCLILSLS
jgi:SHS2 domain-containing protein